MKTLLFIDTNLLLDFYRVRNDVRIELINQLEKISASLVCTYQVEMEFKKNRQSAILECSGQLKAPASVPRPPILSDDRSYAALSKDIESASKRVKALNERLARILEDPVRNDPVYRVLQRIFKKKDSLSLHRGSPVADRIRRLAFKRFILGYPPRKSGETSTGDAVNWEWMIACAIQQKANVLIVSRDSDYGVIRNNKGHINDWLREEFQDRVSKKARVRMTTLLSEALRELHVPVSKMAEKGEIKFVESAPPAREEVDFVDYFASLGKEAQVKVADEMVAENINDVLEEPDMCSAMAETNATDWGVDDYQVESFMLSKESVEIRLRFWASGLQDEEKPACGTSIHGSTVLTLDGDKIPIFSKVTVYVRK